MVVSPRALRRVGYHWTLPVVFQAEGGIRDKLVTGVQTCALPISSHGIKNLDSLLPEVTLRFRVPTATNYPTRSNQNQLCNIIGATLLAPAAMKIRTKGSLQTR